MTRIELETEEWRAIKGYEGSYEISSFGRVRSLDRIVHGKDGRIINRKGKLLNIVSNKKGIKQVDMSANSTKARVTLSHLVMEGFSNNPGAAQVRYKDNDYSNCKLSNLEYYTNTSECNLKKRKYKYGDLATS